MEPRSSLDSHPHAHTHHLKTKHLEKYEIISIAITPNSQNMHTNSFQTILRVGGKNTSSSSIPTFPTET